MNFEDWGLINYSESFKKQQEYVEEVSSHGEEKIIFCTHPSVVTLGRASSQSDLSDWQGEVVQINRGGKATYHGPSQLVVYPLIDLSKPHKVFPARDIGAYLRALENWVIEALSAFDLKAHAISTSKESDKIFTGVWVGEKKVASIGIAVRKWITHHGCAINLEKDDQAFSGINPCGFKTEVMSSLEQELGRKISYQEMKSALISAFRW